MNIFGYLLCKYEKKYIIQLNLLQCIRNQYNMFWIGAWSLNTSSNIARGGSIEMQHF